MNDNLCLQLVVALIIPSNHAQQRWQAQRLELRTFQLTQNPLKHVQFQ